VPKRRSDDRNLAGRVAHAVAQVAWGLCGRAARRPIDSGAIFVAAAMSLTIMANSLFWQSRSRPTPVFASAKFGPLPSETFSKPAPGPTAPGPAASAGTTGSTPLSQPLSQPLPQPAAARRNDPIAELIGPSPRIMAVQKALSDYGYGQIKPTGILDEATSDAIERFERDHKLPVTGRVTNRLVGAITAMSGRSIE
jgi:hypothetical protein